MNLKDKKVVVTGGAGFIGSHLVHHLLKEGSKILILDNLSVGKKKFIPKNVLFKQVDIRSKNLNNIISMFEPDIVIHLAAIHYIPHCNANPEKTFDINVMGTRNILKVSDPRIFLFASSAAVYPPLDRPLTEDLHGPIDIYGKTKLICEDLVKLYSKRPIITRLFNVYGPNDTNPHLIPEIFKQLKEGKPEIKLGNLTPKRDYIHVNDVCEALITLLKHENKGIYNIGTGKEYSVKQVVDILSEIIGEKINILQEKERIRKVEREHLLADITKIKTKTGWKPKTSLKKGLEKTLRELEDYN